MNGPQWLRPGWPAPPGVHAAFTLRGGGLSRGGYASLNLGTHVGDDPQAVAGNRALLCTALALPAEPVWLEQQHGIRVADLDQERAPGPADAAFTRQPARVCAVLVADCLPVLFATRRGDAVAAAHAGWRGLAAGVLEATVRALGIDGAELYAWLGPAIGPQRFEVGEEVRVACLEADAGCAAAFVRNARGRWFGDLAALARRRLAALGVQAVTDETACTYEDGARFYSHRREQPTGRMAALVWLDGRAGAGDGRRGAR
ncbi:MAG: peptidoglycan editing factor PgeF [Gammaproteobacteria bacterium]|nr:peptidoglycan editing factor PgeF [Gammaproteobacteria bacterium]